MVSDLKALILKKNLILFLYLPLCALLFFGLLFLALIILKTNIIIIFILEIQKNEKTVLFKDFLSLFNLGLTIFNICYYNSINFVLKFNFILYDVWLPFFTIFFISFICYANLHNIDKISFIFPIIFSLSDVHFTLEYAVSLATF